MHYGKVSSKSHEMSLKEGSGRVQPPQPKQKRQLTGLISLVNVGKIPLVYNPLLKEMLTNRKREILN